jgi:hypothetical protein
MVLESDCVASPCQTVRHVRDVRHSYSHGKLGTLHTANRLAHTAIQPSPFFVTAFCCLLCSLSPLFQDGLLQLSLFSTYICPSLPARQHAYTSHETSAIWSRHDSQPSACDKATRSTTHYYYPEYDSPPYSRRDFRTAYGLCYPHHIHAEPWSGTSSPHCPCISQPPRVQY